MPHAGEKIDNVIPDTNTVSLLFPELILVIMATFIFVAGAFRPRLTWWPLLSAVTFVAVLFVAMLGIEWRLWSTLVERSVVASGPLTLDYLGQLLRPLAVLLGLLFALLMYRSAPRDLAAEHTGTLMLTIVGLMIVARANDLVLLFVGLELISVPTYVLLFLGRKDRSSGEATAKYFYLSLLSSGLLLYGLSFLYGMTGTTTLYGHSGELGIREVISGLRAATGEGASLWTLAPLAIVLIFAGLGFKLAAVPFHFYAPDVYQGTTASNAALLAILPKIAGVTALLRLIVAMFPGLALAWQLTVILAVLTMCMGNICALWQNNIRRLLAYSSIAHGGYMLIGLAVSLAADSPEVRTAGSAATLFYLAVYCLASLASFAALTYLGDETREVNGVNELAGLARTQPLAATALAVAMFSFSGIPIFAGFWGKFSLFSSSLDLALTTTSTPLRNWFLVMTVVGALNAAIAAGYYLRVVGVMFFQAKQGELPVGGGAGALATMMTCALLTVGVGLAPRAAMQSAAIAGQDSQIRVSSGRVQAPARGQETGPETAGDAADPRPVATERGDVSNATSSSPALGRMTFGAHGI